MHPLVSVIIPTFNVEKYIEECIESILKQSYENIEVIICDDCSTDRTWEILKQYSANNKVHLYRNDINMSQAYTRNKCISYSKGDYILLQDSDDIADSDRIKKLLEAFEDGIDFVGSACFCFNEIDGTFETWSGKCTYPQKKDLLFRIPFVHASILFKRECLEAVNGYRQSKHTKRGEDYDLILRLYANGFRGKNITEELYGYRVGKKAILRRDLKSRIDECYIRYEGFKANNILWPYGWLFVLKPIPALLYQMVKYKKIMAGKND